MERVGISAWSWNNTSNRIRLKLQIRDLNEMFNSACFCFVLFSFWCKMGLEWAGGFQDDISSLDVV